MDWNSENSYPTKINLHIQGNPHQYTFGIPHWNFNYWAKVTKAAGYSHKYRHGYQLTSIEDADNSSYSHWISDKVQKYIPNKRQTG